MAAAAPVAMIAGAGLQTIGTLREGAAKEQAAQYNAKIAEYNAGQMEAEGLVAVEKHEQKAAQTVGAARAAYGASGVSSSEGSALDQLQNMASMAAVDSLYIKQGYASKAYGLRSSANMMRYEGEQARTSSYMSAAGQLLGGAGSAMKGGGSLT